MCSNDIRCLRGLHDFSLGAPEGIFTTEQDRVIEIQQLHQSIYIVGGAMNRWFVLFSAYLTQTLQCGIIYTVGAFHVLFLDAFNASHAATALILSLNTAGFYISGEFGRTNVNHLMTGIFVTVAVSLVLTK